MKSGAPDPNELSDLIAQATQGSVPRAPEEPQPSPQSARRKAGFLAVLMVVLVSSTAWVSIEMNREPNPFTPEREAMGLKALMFTTIGSLEDHRAEFGRYPGDLESVFLDEEEYAYTPQGDSFELVGRISNRNLVVEFNSGDDLAPYELAFQSAMRREQT
jgi:hypothetical protein